MNENWPYWFHNSNSKGPLLGVYQGDFKTGWKERNDLAVYVVLPHKWKVGLPNGHTWVYDNKRQAKNAALIARALAAMPSNPTRLGHCSLGKYGQQSALARELGYFFGPNTNHPRKPNHTNIYTLLMKGCLPRSPERQAKLRELAASMPDDWFVKCACLAEHEAEHATKE